MKVTTLRDWRCIGCGKPSGANRECETCRQEREDGVRRADRNRDAAESRKPKVLEAF